MIYALLIIFSIYWMISDFRDWSKADNLKKENQELKDKLRKYDNTSRS